MSAGTPPSQMPLAYSTFAAPTSMLRSFGSLNYLGLTVTGQHLTSRRVVLDYEVVDGA